MTRDHFDYDTISTYRYDTMTLSVPSVHHRHSLASPHNKSIQPGRWINHEEIPDSPPELQGVGFISSCGHCGEMVIFPMSPLPFRISHSPFDV